MIVFLLYLSWQVASSLVEEPRPFQKRHSASFLEDSRRADSDYIVAWAREAGQSIIHLMMLAESTCIIWPFEEKMDI